MSLKAEAKKYKPYMNQFDRITNHQQEEPASSGTRQVAKVTPFVDSVGNNDVLHDQADPLTAPEIPNPESVEVDSPRDAVASTCVVSKPAMLRLRNFAVDPSTNVNSSATAPSPAVTTTASSSSSSWHLAQGQPEPPMQPSVASGNVTQFPEAASKFLRITFVLTATDRQQERDSMARR